MRIPNSEILSQMESAVVTPAGDVERNIYFAGHFDGEGCISFQRDAKGPNPGLTARVASVYKPTILEYVSYFGGSLNTTGQSQIKIGHSHRLQWQWHLSSQAGVLRFVLTIIPYAREKRDQLELARDYLLTRLEHFRSGRVPPRIDPAVVEKMAKLKQFEFREQYAN